MQRLVVVVGATGVGKTKLGIDLAKALGGEVINADAIQFYKGLDIASAKVSCRGACAGLRGREIKG